jgi:hypothetical protein
MGIDGLDFESVGRVDDGRGIGIGGEPVKSSGGSINIGHTLRLRVHSRHVMTAQVQHWTAQL